MSMFQALHVSGGGRLRGGRSAVRPGDRDRLVDAAVDHVDDGIGPGGRPTSAPYGGGLIRRTF